MLVPDLVSRIEERDKLPRQGISKRDSPRLVIVAQRTGEPEIVLLSQPTEGLRDEVIQLHRRADDGLGGQAIPATMSSLSRYLGAQRGWNASLGHSTTQEAVSRVETSRPRCFNNAAAWPRTSMARSYSR